MATATNVRRALKRHRIIERPRLLARLDGSSARVKTLVAPAGYGKTTLAEQWGRRDGRRAAWYTARPSSTDVAALALGLARASTVLVPGCDERLREHLRAVPDAGSRYEVLADLLGEDLRRWPAEGWLVLDEYQEVAGARDAELFVAALVASSPVQMIIASRQRPSWVTSRDLLYGEVLELNQTVLAMDAVEAAEVMGTDDVEAASGIVALTNGWPAVIGLASVSPGGFESAPADVPESLYRFFAEEILTALGERTRSDLATLAIAPVLDRELASKLLGPEQAAEVCASATDVGILVEREGELALHPLARSYLQERSAELGVVVGEETVALCLAHYRARRDWDAAFELLRRMGPLHELEPLLAEALDELLDTARLSTLETWCSVAAQAELDSPIFGVARAEVTLRQGRHAEAQAHAEAAAAVDSPYVFRAFSVAGRAAHLASREEAGLELYRRAESVAATEAERRDARWGQVICASELELPEATEMLEELLRTVRMSNTRDVVRAATCQLSYQIRMGNIDLADADVAWELSESVKDPLVRAAYYVAYANVLALSARYAEAHAIAKKLLRMIHDYRFDFALVYGLCASAMAHCGLRRWKAAESRLTTAIRIARSHRNLHAEQICYALLARAYAQQGRYQLALALEIPSLKRALPAAKAEVLCSRALLLSLVGRLPDARKLLDQGRNVSRGVEPRVLTAGVDAVIALRSHEQDSLAKVHLLEDVAFVSGAVDLLVATYRAAPDVFAVLLRSAQDPDRFASLVRRVGDEDLAAAIGHPVPTPEDPRARLTPREREVYELICQGLTDRQIAQLLYITHATAKRHAHNIYDKLGIRSRRALALQAALERALTTRSATEPPLDDKS
ncbi:MAG TPA: LuxR C-terminal-related transcriptional regulator [Gaiellaceae bacterium]|nr:LuxR C-terminal-related transcriptional regulator [Gaiellaceae bacterium]